MAGAQSNKEMQKMSFEDALAELKEIVSTLDSGDGKLDQAIESYERGAKLKRHCEAKLREAQEKNRKDQPRSQWRRRNRILRRGLTRRTRAGSSSASPSGRRR